MSQMSQISQTQFLSCLMDASKRGEGAPLDVAACLTAAGFSTQLSCITLDADTPLMHARLSGVQFFNCTIDWCAFDESHLSDTQFVACNLRNVSFINTSFENCLFQDCIMREVMMACASLDGVSFERCDLVIGSFENARILDSRFDTVTMAGTHFLNAEVSGSSIRNSHLENSVFFDVLQDFDVDCDSRKTVGLTKPTAVLLIDPEDRGTSIPRVLVKLDQVANMIPLRIAMRSPSIDRRKFDHEIDIVWQRVAVGAAGDLPIAQRLLRIVDDAPETFAQLTSITAKAKTLSANVNAIVLPGGEDLPSALYGEEEEIPRPGSDYRRSLLELALLRESLNRGIPMLAICRGFQLVNVYFGAKMRQNVEGQRGKRDFDLTPGSRNGIYGEAMRETLASVVSHHQAIPVSAQSLVEHLKPSVVHEGLVEAVESPHAGAVPALMLQFHPEFFRTEPMYRAPKSFVPPRESLQMSSANQIFWKIFSDAAQAHRAKQAVIGELKGPRAKPPSASAV
ncbi:gamma-glutamyl-gamma-aminobutyrate hydrolase family protein [Pandoraea faecigallinarum]|nr:gamma-glutamyl-gamma-aminobutyrate hydrolase family protein [Pandoraea faecigallinarum]